MRIEAEHMGIPCHLGTHSLDLTDDPKSCPKRFHALNFGTLELGKVLQVPPERRTWHGWAP